jgi:thymidylate kinase
MTDPIKPESPTVPGGPPRRIVLTGFMGSGKSTVGPILAQRLGWSFIDVDEVIEAEPRVPIAELFARHGEAAFREREQETIARLHAAGDGRVLALTWRRNRAPGYTEVVAQRSRHDARSP